MLKEVEARAAEDPRSAGELLAELRSYKEAVYNDPDVGALGLFITIIICKACS